MIDELRTLQSLDLEKFIENNYAAPLHWPSNSNKQGFKSLLLKLVDNCSKSNKWCEKSVKFKEMIKNIVFQMNEDQKNEILELTGKKHINELLSIIQGIIRGDPNASK